VAALRGQVTLEFILLFGFFILLFLGVSFPMARDAYQGGYHLSATLEARSNLDALVSAMEAVQSQYPNASRTLSLTFSRPWRIETDTSTDGAAESSRLPGEFQNQEVVILYYRWENAEELPEGIHWNRTDSDGAWAALIETTDYVPESQWTPPLSGLVTAGDANAENTYFVNGTWTIQIAWDRSTLDDSSVFEQPDPDQKHLIFHLDRGS
jgi:hypothetical protein